jgi:hypothetical protein
MELGKSLMAIRLIRKQIEQFHTISDTCTALEFNATPPLKNPSLQYEPIGPGIIVLKIESGFPITSWFPTRTTISPDFTWPVFSAEPPSISALTVTRTKPEGSSSSTKRIPTPIGAQQFQDRSKKTFLGQRFRRPEIEAIY